MSNKLSPEAEIWLYRLLMYGSEGMPHEEFRVIDTGENEDKPWYKELYLHDYVDYSYSTNTLNWNITEAGIDYLKRRNANEKDSEVSGK